MSVVQISHPLPRSAGTLPLQQSTAHGQPPTVAAWLCSQCCRVACAVTGLRIGLCPTRMIVMADVSKPLQGACAHNWAPGSHLHRPRGAEFALPEMFKQNVHVQPSPQEQDLDEVPHCVELPLGSQ